MQVTDQYFGELSNSQQTTDSKQFNILKPVTGTLGMVGRNIQNIFNVHGSAQRQGQMSFHADPITDNNDIYEAYLGFANDPGLFIVSDCAPKKGDYHVMRKERGCYYWVPAAAAPMFQALVLKTTFMRGPEAPPVGYYERKIVDLQDQQLVNPGRSDLQRALAVFDKSVPNGKASLVLILPNGRKVQLKLLLVFETPDKKRLELGDQTTRLEVRWSLKSNGITELDLRVTTVRIYSEDYPPELTPTSTIPEEILHDVNRIRSSISPFMRPPGS